MGPPKVGGPVDPRANLYIARSTDAEFLALLRAGEYVNLITSRQMGKTSLVYRAMEALEPEGVRFAYYDLSALRHEADARVFFRTLVEELERDLDLAIDLGAFWAERANKANGACLADFFRQALEAVDGPLVVVLDEIDSTLESRELAYTDDLFTTLRSLYNARPREPAFKRLSFCLVGVATPNELIKARRTTPYNVGRTLWLADFDAERDDLDALDRFLDDARAAGTALRERLLHWTGGQPYLTMWLASELKHAGARTPGDVDRLVEDHFASLEKVRGEAHFDQTQRFIFDRGDSAAVLDLYERILRGTPQDDQPANPVYAQLKLSGLVRRDAAGRLVVRNEIYARLFDRAWVARSRPRRALRKARRTAVAAVALLVLVVGGGAVYYQSRVAPIVSAQDARIALRDLGFEVDDTTGLTLVRLSDGATGARGAALDADALLRRAAPDLAALGRGGEAQPLAMELTGLPLTDIAPLAELPRLQQLGLSGTLVRDLAPLARLGGLERLDLAGTPVSDLAPLAGLPRLEYLDISHSQVHDLKPLEKLPALRTLHIEGLGIERFEHPGVQVYGETRPRAADPRWKVGQTFRDCDQCPEMVVVPAGHFTMGSPDNEAGRDPDEGPQHRVGFAQAFALGRTEVTVGEFRRFVAATGYKTEAEFEPDKGVWVWDGNKSFAQSKGKSWRDPGFAQTESQPVVGVSWKDAQAYVNWLTDTTGQPYRLPSEAEWEYAARGGTTSSRDWGHQADQACRYANVADRTLKVKLPNWPWSIHDCDDGYVYTAPVASFKANAFGLYDMSGNAAEWSVDCYHDRYTGAPDDGVPWDQAVCGRRVVRGGSWYYDPVFARAAGRLRIGPSIRFNFLGFRLARTL